MNEKSSHTRCCIIGGGPAGVMLGYLLARAGVPVTVLEKHVDFFRDFRGDTVHPSTLDVLHELNLLDEFLKLPHQELTSAGGVFGDFAFQAASFKRVPTHCQFVAVMPQWDFLNFLSDQGKKHQSFDLRMEHKATDLLWENGRVCGVLVNTPGGTEEIRADLVIGCDGRHSIARTAARLPLREVGVPLDVLWFRISRRANDPEQVFGNVNYGKVLVLINRGDYFQAALLIQKGSFERVKDEGLEALRRTISQIAPFLHDRVEELRDWEQIKLLSVQINRLKRWYRPGLLCIGDAAHAMSPVFGVGINLAIQDAVATANLLGPTLRDGNSADRLLNLVQRRRELPTWVTQLLQRMAHRGIQYVFRRQGQLSAPWPFRAITRVPAVRHTMGRMVGVGIRPEHIAGAIPKRRAAQRVATSVPRIIALIMGVAVGVSVACRGLKGQRG